MAKMSDGGYIPMEEVDQTRPPNPPSPFTVMSLDNMIEVPPSPFTVMSLDDMIEVLKAGIIPNKEDYELLIKKMEELKALLKFAYETEILP